jgi:Asp-tRNA(Asn)/Glu-tRNA(Gln) amidotransferase A subunit family amidase
MKTHIRALFALVFSASALLGAESSTVYSGPEEATIAQIQDAYLAGRLTAHDLTAAYLARIAAYDKKGPYLNALITVNAKALEDADKLDAELKSTGKLVGSLHGIPVVVKDNLDTTDMPTSGGVALFKNFVPSRDAFVVAKLRKAGAIIIAKSSLSELAMGLADCINSVLPGFTRNPYNTAYASGGSSGGTGVALAASFAVVGLGTDTGGSVRAPSSINNLVGIRPTVGLVSRTGMGPLDSQRDTPGPMGRDVEDVARLLDVMAGVDPADARTAPAEGHIPPTYTAFLNKDALKGARIGVFRQSYGGRRGSDPRVIAIFDKAVNDLRASGAVVVDDFTVPGFEDFPSPPQTAAQSKADWERYFAYEGPGFPVKTVAQLSESKIRVHPLHQARVAEIAAQKLPPEKDPATVQGRKDEQMYRDKIGAAMDAAHVDALVFPVWSYPPKINGDRNQTPQGSLTFVGSATQWPVVVVPMGFVDGELPVGFQIFGKPWTEPQLIGYAYAYEQATHHRRPPPTTPPLAESMKGKFIGTWKLVAIRNRDWATGAETPATPAADNGQLVYSANGRLSVQIVRVGRDKLPAGSAQGFSSYFGTWELKPDEGCMIHHQDGNLSVAGVGQAGKRYYSFDEKGWLSLATPPRKGTDGRDMSSVFVWERIP